MKWPGSAPNVGSGTADLNVGSTAGFPDSGTILVGNEKMTYSEKTDTAFKIDQNGRQADNTSGFVSAIGDITADITATVTSITIDGVSSARTSTETKPKNMRVVYIMKVC